MDPEQDEVRIEAEKKADVHMVEGKDATKKNETVSGSPFLMNSSMSSAYSYSSMPSSNSPYPSTYSSFSSTPSSYSLSSSYSPYSP